MQARRLAAVSWCAFALAAPFATPAHALVPQHAVTAASTYLPSTELTVVQGHELFLVNLDTLDHDLVSDNMNGGDHLFGSSPTGAGGRVEVFGVSTLAASVYPFHCSLHSNMRGNLTVLGVGQ